ncbi:hypothetical protein [Peribacillus butanolivorans]|uniref:hypothetical protein n=1 Tax=Peribacillus butanolivorans TaxID=421767 RepID=UPI003F64D58A
MKKLKLKMTPCEAIVETLVQKGIKHFSGILRSAFKNLLDLLEEFALLVFVMNKALDIGRCLLPCGYRTKRAWNDEHGNFCCSSKSSTYAYDFDIIFRGNSYCWLGRILGM